LSPEQVRIYVNNRRLMDHALSSLEIAKDLRIDVFRVVDKIDKLSEKEWRNFALETGLSNIQVDGLLEVLKNDTLWRDSEELVEFFDLIRSFGVADYIEYNPKVIRGLDYYTGTVFEAYELGGLSRALLGGGRYDNLVADVGGNPLPGVGFAMGDVVMELVLRDAGVIPSKLSNYPQVIVTLFGDETLKDTLEVAKEIRDAGFRVVIYPDADKMGKQLKYADRLEIPIAVVLGPDELANSQVAVKNLKTRQQVTVNRQQVLSQIEAFLSS